MLTMARLLSNKLVLKPFYDEKPEVFLFSDNYPVEHEHGTCTTKPECQDKKEHP